MKTRRLALWMLVVAVALLGAACGGGGGDDGTDGVATANGDEGSEDESDDDGGGGGGDVDESEMQDAALEYAQCMRDHGINMPDPEFDGEGGVAIEIGPDEEGGGINPDDPDFQAAQEACQSIMDEVRPQEQLSPEEQAERQDQMVEWAECMRGKGHDIADPVVDENGGVRIGGPAPAEGAQGDGGSAPEDDEQFRDDAEACDEEVGMEGPGGGPGDDEEQSDDEEGDA